MRTYAGEFFQKTSVSSVSVWPLSTAINERSDRISSAERRTTMYPRTLREVLRSKPSSAKARPIITVESFCVIPVPTICSASDTGMNSAGSRSLGRRKYCCTNSTSNRGVSNCWLCCASCWTSLCENQYWKPWR